jgi:nucleotide-binding universal stress UspA family protein
LTTVNSAALRKEAMDRTARLVVKDAKKWDADLIVVGSHGKTGLDRLVLGSVAESVIRTAQRRCS